jgi:LPS sulfotransferase NodH
LLFFPFFREYYLRNCGCHTPYYNKLHWVIYDICLNQINLDELVPNLKYVRIKRLDYADVAVSMHIKDCGKKRKKVRYDEEQLLTYYHMAKERDALWDEYLNRRKHLSFEYNEVVENPIAVVKSIIQHSGYTGEHYLNLQSQSIAKISEHPLKEKLRKKFKACLTQCTKS